ncbi:unnamed protein product [Calypogeia fissa]
MYLEPGPPLEIREVSPYKGRGVFAVTALAAKSLVHVSPILLFPTDQYESHGKFTLLDHYTFRWPGGMALALGLGSIFNHSREPNVGFVRDVVEGVIRFVTLRDVEAGEELCISYGKRLWFKEEGGSGSGSVGDGDDEEVEETAEAFLGSIELVDDCHDGEHGVAGAEGHVEARKETDSRQ